MPRATCRCGQVLNVPPDGTDRIVCDRCGAKIRVRLPARPPSDGAGSTEEGGVIRFACPCGRRLKVTAIATTKAAHARCPDCSRVVPVPMARSARDPESPTEELSAADVALIDAWSKRHLAAAAGSPASTHVLPAGQAPFKTEAGLRLCPACGKPVHLGSVVCRECGGHVPKR